MKKVFLLLLSINVLISCEDKMEEETPLPFYNSALFTPEWIAKGEEKYNQIHKIEDYSLINQNGDTISNESLKGKIYVADFFFTFCPSICPKMTSNLSRLQNAFSANQVQLVSFSVMPWVDSVSVLYDYASLYNIKSDQWNLLTGDTEEIYSLARKSFFAEKEIGLNKKSNEFLHTENFILVDKEGRIRGVYNGTLGLEMNRLKKDIETLLELG